MYIVSDHTRQARWRCRDHSWCHARTVHVCMYSYLHMYKCTYICICYTYIHICYTYICVLYICIYVYMNIYMFMCIDSDDTPRALLGVVMAACCDVKALHMCVYVCLNVFICMHVYIYTCTHTHTHTHTHTRIARWKRWS